MTAKPPDDHDPFGVDLPPGYRIDKEVLDDGLYDRVLMTLQRRQRAMPALAQLLDELRDDTDGRSERADATGSVRVIRGSDGVPLSITVDPDWARRVGAEGLAAAVTEAGAAATLAGIEALGGRGGNLETFEQRATELLDYLTGDGPLPPGLRVDQAAAGDVMVPASPLWTVEEAEALLGELGDVDGVDDPAELSYTGYAAHGRLTLTLGADRGLTCEAEPEWVSRQSADELNGAFAIAVRSLTADRESRAAATERAMSAPIKYIAAAQAHRGSANGFRA